MATESRKPAALKAEAKAVDEATSQVDEAVANETAQGFRGTEIDSTPNEHYTVQGQGAGLPTPEDDPDQAAKVGSTKYRTA